MYRIMSNNPFENIGFGSKLRIDDLVLQSNEANIPMKISFLGGINEVGKNLTVFEYGEDMILLDCGLAFPDSTLPGVDLVLPDFTYIEENADRLKGIFITHAHEDHIGGLAYLLQKVHAPIYATLLAVNIIASKLEEHDVLSTAVMHTIEPGDNVACGNFMVEAIHVNHSVPDAIAFAIRTDAGTIIHTGDFKIDFTPIDADVIDLTRFAEISKENVLCMLADSTNAERPGYTESEKIVGETLYQLFQKAGNKRVIVATFASNIHRIQQIISTSEAMGRKVVLSGRSIENVVKIANELEYMNIKPGTLVEIDQINEYKDEQLTIITTGSQGETMSALTRMSTGMHRRIKIGPNDMIIISATPIPGNEKTVGNVINDLIKLGAEVAYSKMYDVHVSGHACQEELKLMLNLVKPKYYIPIHGEQKHLIANKKIAQSVGVPAENIFVVNNGTSIEISEYGAFEVQDVPSGRVIVDGYGVGDIGNIVIRDRTQLGDEGVFIIGIAVEYNTLELIGEPIIESRGFTFVSENEEIYNEVIDLVKNILKRGNFPGTNNLKSKIRDEVGRLIYNRIKRSPIIIPLIIDLDY
jgi:ribonuclease J